MGYDASKDKCLLKLDPIQLGSNVRLEIGVYQYNGGAKKVRVLQFTKRAGDKEWHDVVFKGDATIFAALVGQADKLAAALI